MSSLLCCRSGSAAVEFAMVVPVFLTILFGIVVFGSYLAVVHGVQQLAAEAARSSISGISETERGSLAAQYVSANAGVCRPDRTLAPASCFVPSATAPFNAVRVSIQNLTPLYFAHFFTGEDHFVLRASATAARSAIASFSIGSRLLSLNGGLLNAMVSGMLGSNINLSVMRRPSTFRSGHAWTVGSVSDGDWWPGDRDHIGSNRAD